MSMFVHMIYGVIDDKAFMYLVRNFMRIKGMPKNRVRNKNSLEIHISPETL